MAIAFQPAKLTACCRRMQSRPQSDPCKLPRRSHMGTRDSSGWAGGAGRGAPRLTNGRARRRAPIPSGAWGRPERGAFTARRAQPKKARGGIGCKPVSPRSGAPKARLGAKEETRQAAQALLASVNASGSTRSDRCDGMTSPYIKRCGVDRGEVGALPYTRRGTNACASRFAGSLGGANPSLVPPLRGQQPRCPRPAAATSKTRR